MERGIVDFHTHAFPDALADRAMRQLHSEADVQSFLDGKLSSLLDSMARNNIAKSVLCCIATRPNQFEPILDWCRQIRSDRIVPFPSVHPEDPQAVRHIEQIAEAGFKGIKLHPYYQDFFLDDPSLWPLYEVVSSAGLLLTVHTGFDIAFERIERASPRQVLDVIGRFSELKLITTHFGGWQQWDEVERLLIGKPVYMETSWSLEELGPERTKRMLLSHLPEYILFGTDSPWTDQGLTVTSYKNLDLSMGIAEKFFGSNALSLLNQVP